MGLHRSIGRSTAARLLLAASCLPGLSNIARAECVSAGLPGLPYCNNCRVAGTLTVDRDQACERPFNPSNRDNVQILSLRIAKGAKHGRAGVTSYSVAYMPAKGFTGRDDFSVELSWRLGTQSGKLFVDYAVTVR